VTVLFRSNVVADVSADTGMASQQSVTARERAQEFGPAKGCHRES
jgi:hypothetical protein